MRHLLLIALLVHLAGRASTVDLTRATIADLNRAFADGTLPSEDLTQFYLARIAAYDKQGPKTNAARVRDAERKAGDIRRPLYGIPIGRTDMTRSSVDQAFRDNSAISLPGMLVGKLCLFYFLRLVRLHFLRPTLIDSLQAPFGTAL